MTLKTNLSAVDADSYVTLAEAKEYLADNAEFMALADGAMETLLKKATMQIDSMRFFGEKATYNQALAFPRTLTDAYGQPYSQDAIPSKVKMATCEQAAHILDGTSTKRMQMQEDGVRSASIGDVSESYAGKVAEISISVTAKGLLKGFVSRLGRVVNY
jgi:hypothetical protein